MQRLILLFCAVTAATSLVVGCGSDSDSGSSTAGGSSAAGASSSAGTASSVGGSDAQCVGDYSDLQHGALTAAVSASGMCAGAADVSSICSNDVTAKAEGCGLDCLTMGAADMNGCVGDCLGTQVTPALSAACTSCYVTDVGCARDHCAIKCLSPSSTACMTCRQQFGCIDAFYSCSGLPVPGSSSDGTGGASDTSGATAGAGG